MSYFLNESSLFSSTNNNNNSEKECVRKMLLTLTRDGRRCMFSIIQRETLDNASVDVLNKLIEVGGRDLRILEDDE
jgi:hypothetical protein